MAATAERDDNSLDDTGLVAGAADSGSAPVPEDGDMDDMDDDLVDSELEAMAGSFEDTLLQIADTDMLLERQTKALVTTIEGKRRAEAEAAGLRAKLTDLERQLDAARAAEAAARATATATAETTTVAAQEAVTSWRSRAETAEAALAAIPRPPAMSTTGSTCELLAEDHIARAVAAEQAKGSSALAEQSSCLAAEHAAELDAASQLSNAEIAGLRRAVAEAEESHIRDVETERAAWEAERTQLIADVRELEARVLSRDDELGVIMPRMEEAEAEVGRLRAAAMKPSVNVDDVDQAVQRQLEKKRAATADAGSQVELSPAPISPPTIAIVTADDETAAAATGAAAESTTVAAAVEAGDVVPKAVHDEAVAALNTEVSDLKAEVDVLERKLARAAKAAATTSGGGDNADSHRAEIERCEARIKELKAETRSLGSQLESSLKRNALLSESVKNISAQGSSGTGGGGGGAGSPSNRASHAGAGSTAPRFHASELKVPAAGGGGGGGGTGTRSGSSYSRQPSHRAATASSAAHTGLRTRTGAAPARR